MNANTVNLTFTTFDSIDESNPTDDAFHTTTRANETLVSLRLFAFYIGQIYPWAYCIVGIPLNIATIVVMCQRWVVTSHVIYVTLLSAVDSVALLHKLLGSHFLTFSITATSGYCRYMQFMVQTSSQISNWILVLLSFERAVVVKFPFSRLTVLNTRRTLVSVSTAAASLILVNFHLFFTVTSYEGRACTYEAKFYTAIKRYWYIVATLLFAIFPMVLLTASNLVIVASLFQRKRLKDRQTQQKTLVCHQLSDFVCSDSGNSITNSSKMDINKSNRIISAGGDIDSIINDGEITNNNISVTYACKGVTENKSNNVLSDQNKRVLINPYHNDEDVKRRVSKDIMSLNADCVQPSKKLASDIQDSVINFDKPGEENDKHPIHKEREMIEDTHWFSDSVSEVVSGMGDQTSGTFQPTEKRGQNELNTVKRFGQKETRQQKKDDHHTKRRDSNKAIGSKCRIQAKHRPGMIHCKENKNVGHFNCKMSRAEWKNKHQATPPETFHDQKYCSTSRAYDIKSNSRMKMSTFEVQFMKTTRSIIVASITFVVLTTPYCIGLIYAQMFHAGGAASATYQHLVTIAFALRDLNHVANFFIYSSQIKYISWRRRVRPGVLRKY